MKMISKVFLAAFGAAALLAVPAKAATFSVDFLDPAVLGTPLANDTSGIVQEGVSGDVFALRKSPWATTSHPDETYTAVTQKSSATYDISGSSVSFLWGSVDKFNTVYFFSGNTLFDSLTGENVLDANVGVTEGDLFTNILIQASGAFDRIVFASTSSSFEYANIQVTAVPLPAGLPLYGAGLAVLGFVGWRKRKKANAA